MRLLSKGFAVFALLVLSGCSYIQSLFPDKEKDYQYTTEIPLLNWPTELRQSKPSENPDEGPLSSPKTENAETNADGASGMSPPGDEGSQPNIMPTPERSGSPAENKTEVGNSEPAREEEAGQNDTVSSIEIVKYDDGESRLRLGTGYSKSWRLVNKALTRNTIEVTERNHEQGYVTIQYDPDEIKAKDGSFMDEISFIFEGINMNDKEYNLKFEEHDGKTDVIALDSEHLPLLNDNNAIRLLKLLSDTIKTDLDKKAK